MAAGLIRPGVLDAKKKNPPPPRAPLPPARRIAASQPGSRGLTGWGPRLMELSGDTDEGP